MGGEQTTCSIVHSLPQQTIRAMATRFPTLRGGKKNEKASGSSSEEDPSFKASQDEIMNDSSDEESDVDLPSEELESSSVFDEAKAKEEEKYLPIELPPRVEGDYRSRMGRKFGRRKPKELEADEDASAAENDRTEGWAPFYNGVEVSCLFVDQDSGVEQWCDGRILYTKRSSQELRIEFQQVPEWEASNRIYWPSDDKDIRVKEGQEGGKHLSNEERMMMSRQMLDAARDNNFFLACKLVWFGADIRYTQDSKISFLHLAVLHNDANATRFALEKGVDVNAKMKDGNTPLHLAVVLESSLDVIRELVKYKANLVAVNHEGLNPVDLAEYHQRDKICRVLNKLIMRAQTKKATATS